MLLQIIVQIYPRLPLPLTHSFGEPLNSGPWIWRQETWLYLFHKMHFDILKRLVLALTTRAKTHVIIYPRVTVGHILWAARLVIKFLVYFFKFRLTSSWVTGHCYWPVTHMWPIQKCWFISPMTRWPMTHDQWSKWPMIPWPMTYWRTDTSLILRAAIGILYMHFASLLHD